MKTKKINPTKIQLVRNNNFFLKCQCPMTKEIFKTGGFDFKIMSGKYAGSLVCPDYALKNGFTISNEEFQNLNELISAEELSQYSVVDLLKFISKKIEHELPF